MKTKWVVRNFFVWNEEKEIAYHEAMAKKGWLLEKVNVIFYKYAKSNPGDYVYAFDCNSSNESDYADKQAFFSEHGWEYIDKKLGCHYHYYRAKRTSVNDSPFYTDVTSLDATFKPIIKTLLLLASINLIAGFAYYGITEVRGTTRNFAGLGVGVLNFFTAFLMLYGVYRIHRKIIDFAIKDEQKEAL